MRDTYHHGNLASELLRLGELEIAMSGLQHFGLREVARKAGVSNSATFRHFENKDHLVREIAAEGFRDLIARLHEGDHLVPDARLRWGFSAYIALALERPGCLRAMFGGILERSSPESDAVVLSLDAFAWLTDAVKTGLESGLLAQGTPRTALAFFAAMHGAAVLSLEMGSFPEVGRMGGEELADLLFETLVRHS